MIDRRELHIALAVMTDMIPRPVPEAEIGRAAEIFRSAMMTVPCFDATLHSPREDKAFWREQIYPHCQILGAYRDGRLLGQVAISAGWIHHLHVDPAHQDKGVGSGLVEAVKARFDDIQLWTFQANVGARRFYERHGFIAMELTDGARNEEKEPDVRYRWLR